MPTFAFLEYGPPLLAGALMTVKLTVLSETVALLAGFLVGPALLSNWTPLRVACKCYVELFRGTSALIQLFFLYFVLPQLGVDLPPVLVAVLGLGLNSGAYCAEFIRGAILAVPRGQREAAAALGLSPSDRFRFVILPQAAFYALPPLGNMSIDLLKLTSIVSFITIADLTFVAYQINQTTLDTIPLFSMVLLFYFVLAQAIAFVFRKAEGRLGRGMQRVSSRA
jgi:polar amino acid transport system permease protein